MNKPIWKIIFLFLEGIFPACYHKKIKKKPCLASFSSITISFLIYTWDLRHDENWPSYVPTTVSGESLLFTIFHITMTYRISQKHDPLSLVSLNLTH